MSTALDDALHLPVEERLALIEALWNSIVDEHGDGLPLAEADRAELDRRLAAHEEAPDETEAWEDVRARLLARSTAK